MQSLDQQLTAFRTFRGFVKNTLPLEDAAETCGDEDEKHRAAWVTVSSSLKRGSRLSEVIRDAKLWPDMVIKAIEAAEATNRLELVFDVLCTITENKRRVASMLKGKLIAPAVYLVMSVTLMFVSTLVVFPLMSGTIKKREGLIAMLDGVHAFMHVALLPVVAVGLASAGFLIYCFNTSSGANLLFRLLDRSKGWGNGLRSVSLSYWCSFVKLMSSAGSLHEDDVIRLATDTLPDVHAEPFLLLQRESASKGSLSRASDRKAWAKSDPRRQWPALFAAGLKAAAVTGNLGESMGSLSADLLDAGLVRIQKSIDTLALVGILMTILGVGMIMGIYSLSQLAQVLAVY